MSTPATSPRHPWELLLEQLTGRMTVTIGGISRPVVHGFGVEDDAKNAAPDRVVWIPGEPNFEACPFDLPACRVVELLTLQFSVPIYGGSLLEVIQRARELDGWIFVIMGRRQGTAGDPAASPPVLPQPGYELRAKGKPTKGGDAAGTSWRLELAIVLKDFVRAEVRPLLTITHPSVTATAAAGQGATNPGDVAWQG